MPNTPPLIPYSRQYIDEDDIQAVVQVLKSDFLTQGPKVLEFEKEIASYCGAQYAVAFSSGTAALHAACVVLGVTNGDEGIVPPITFAATANCLFYVGATPVFADVTDGLPLMDVAQIEKKIGKRTKAILPVHFSGAICAMDQIHALAQKHKLSIIEDACHALGASYQDKAGKWHKVGDCRHSDVTIFSFHPVKSMTTGEGGMITTNSKSLYDQLVILRQHGISRPSGHPDWHYEMRSLGFNYRMTELQAALGVSQLKKLDSFIKVRHENFERYKEKLASLPEIKLLECDASAYSSLHLSIILVKDEKKRDALFSHLRTKGIAAQVHYIPVYRHPYYFEKGYEIAHYPKSEAYFSKAISLPNYFKLSLEEQNQVIDAIYTFFQK